MKKDIRINTTSDEIQNYIKLFDADEKEEEDALKLVFSNKAFSSKAGILARVVLLNDFYSTQLRNTSGTKRNDKIVVDKKTMAAHISKCVQLESLIKSGDTFAFEYIASGLGDEYEHCASFASKYCSWINEEAFPITDRYSRGVLYYTNKIEQYYTDEVGTPISITQSDLKDYSTFCKVHKAFKEKHLKADETQFSTKDIDKFFWKFGLNNPEVAID